MEGQIDVGRKRRELELVALRERFGGRTRARLTSQEIEDLDNLLDQQVMKYRDDTIATQLPEAMKAAERRLEYMRAISGSLLQLRLTEKNFRLALRVVTPYGDN